MNGNMDIEKEETQRVDVTERTLGTGCEADDLFCRPLKEEDNEEDKEKKKKEMTNRGVMFTCFCYFFCPQVEFYRQTH